MGVLSREETLKRLDEPSDEKIVEEVKQKTRADINGNCKRVSC